jgi:hypothetical protein
LSQTAAADANCAESLHAAGAAEFLGTYDGDFLDGQMHGRGVFTFPANGGTFDGYFDTGVRRLGVFTTADGRGRFEATFTADGAGIAGLVDLGTGAQVTNFTNFALDATSEATRMLTRMPAAIQIGVNAATSAAPSGLTTHVNASLALLDQSVYSPHAAVATAVRVVRVGHTAASGASTVAQIATATTTPAAVTSTPPGVSGGSIATASPTAATSTATGAAATSINLGALALTSRVDFVTGASIAPPENDAELEQRARQQSEYRAARAAEAAERARQPRDMLAPTSGVNAALLPADPSSTGRLGEEGEGEGSGDAPLSRPDWTVGHGVLRFTNGDEYKGALLDGRPSGTGVMVRSNGDVYEGEWRGGKPHGRGRLTRAVENRAAAQAALVAHDDKAQPHIQSQAEPLVFGPTEEAATLDSTTWWRYDGAWLGGVPHGRGSLWLDSNGAAYHGMFRHGKRDGLGSEVAANGARYEGPFVAGKRHGLSGVLSTSLVDAAAGRPNGVWVCGRPAPQLSAVEATSGADTSSDAGGLYATYAVFRGAFSEGECCDAEAGSIEYFRAPPPALVIAVPGGGAPERGVRSAPGAASLPPPPLAPVPVIARYVGGIRGLNRHGQGHMEYADGDKYDGEFAENVRAGVGQWVLARAGRGCVYEGAFESDRPEGSGALLLAPQAPVLLLASGASSSIKPSSPKAVAGSGASAALAIAGANAVVGVPDVGSALVSDSLFASGSDTPADAAGIAAAVAGFGALCRGAFAEYFQQEGARSAGDDETFQEAQEVLLAQAAASEPVYVMRGRFRGGVPDGAVTVTNRATRAVRRTVFVGGVLQVCAPSA